MGRPKNTAAGRKAKCRRKGGGTLERRGSIWLARYVVDGKRVTQSTGTSDKREAQKILDELTAGNVLHNAIATQQNVVAKLGGIKAELQAYEDKLPALTLANAFTAYRKSPERNQRAGADTLRMYESQYNRFLDWAAENYPDAKEMRQISREVAKQFAQHLGEEVSANTFNKYQTLLASMWQTLHEEAKLTVNPWERIKRKEKDTHSRRELTIEELQRVADCTEGEMRLLFAVGVYTGLRLGDCCQLDWGSVDLLRGIVSVLPHKTAHTGRRVVIPLHSTLRTMLAETPAAARKGYVLPELAEMYQRDRAAVTDRIQAVFKKCGIATAKKEAGKRAQLDVGFHSLRHTFVSLAANAGVPLAVVQKIVGHGSPLMTEAYFHESTAASAAAVNTLPDLSQPAAAVTCAQIGTQQLAMLRAIADRLGVEDLKEAGDYISKLLKDKTKAM